MTRAPMSSLDGWQLEDDAQDIRGWPVRDQRGTTLGRVTDLVGDTDTGYVDSIVLDNGVELDVDTVHIHDGVVMTTAAAMASPVGPPAGEDADEERGPGPDRSEMILSQEQVRVDTEQVPAGRLRLRKRVVTENVTYQVPVSHEEVRVEREPILPGERAGYDAGHEAEEAIEVTLTAERPVVAKEVVPVERVRAVKGTVTDQVPVTETVAREEAELEEHPARPE